MTQTAHTPTPCSPYYLHAGSLEVWICRNLGERLNHTDKSGSEGREILARLAFTMGTGEADGVPLDYEKVMTNAAFIVKACNAHDELVEALQRLTSEAECLAAGGKRDALFDKVFTEARAILAKVQSS